MRCVSARPSSARYSASTARPSSLAAEVGTPEAFAKFQRRRGSSPPLPGTVLESVMQTMAVSHIDDDAANPSPSAPTRVARSMLGVPMLKDGKLIGAIVIYRVEVRPFTDRQVALVQTFARKPSSPSRTRACLTSCANEPVDWKSSYGSVRQQASQLEAQSQELRTLNQQLEQRVDEQVGEIERMGRLRRFLPPQVADLIVSSGTENSSKATAARSRRCSATCAASRAFPRPRIPKT